MKDKKIRELMGRLFRKVNICFHCKHKTYSPTNPYGKRAIDQISKELSALDVSRIDRIKKLTMKTVELSAEIVKLKKSALNKIDELKMAEIINNCQDICCWTGKRLVDVLMDRRSEWMGGD